MGPARSWLPSRVRVLGRQRQRPGIQRQQLGAPDLPRARPRRERRELGAGRGTGRDDERGVRSRDACRSGAAEEVRDWRKRLLGEDMGVEVRFF